MFNPQAEVDVPDSVNIIANSEESLHIEQKIPRTLSISLPPQESGRIMILPRNTSDLNLELYPSPIRFNENGGRVSKAHAIGAKTFKNSERKKPTLVI
jgi:hypothetical protein